jgi:N5-(carboxyethyl)ornithine synthase
MKTGVFKTSLKENEKRIPIIPEHLKLIPEENRGLLFFETGFGSDYGVSDESISCMGFNLLDRDSIFRECELLILPKPTIEDFYKMTIGQTIWGWPHCVQNVEITQIAIDKKLTLIAWESMHIWGDKGDKLSHLFYKNNEIAGYAAVHHTLQLLGIDGFYGPRRKVIVLGYGSVSKGAIKALISRGFNDIDVLTMRPTYLVSDQNPDVSYSQYVVNHKENRITVNSNEGDKVDILHHFAKADIIVNGIIQDTDNPIIFVAEDQLYNLKPNSIIIDISCDKNMGFSFAEPTTFNQPTFIVGNNITYYSVDHTPTYFYKAASRELSKVVISFLPVILQGRDTYNCNNYIKNSIEIDRGEIVNPKIFSFQNRDIKYPHNIQQ